MERYEKSGNTVVLPDCEWSGIRSDVVGVTGFSAPSAACLRSALRARSLLSLPGRYKRRHCGVCKRGFKSIRLQATKKEDAQRTSSFLWSG